MAYTGWSAPFVGFTSTGWKTRMFLRGYQFVSDLSNGESDQPLTLKGIRGYPVTFQTRPVIGERNTERRNKNSNPTLITTEATVHQDLQKYRSG